MPRNIALGLLQRVGDRDDDGEAGEDLLLRDLRGVDATVLASAALRRVWVADVAGDQEAPMRPARSVMVHSAIDGLEDGPRVEFPTALPPSVEVERVTLDAVTVSRDGQSVRAFASTMSGGVAGPSCVPGAWAFWRRAVGEAPLPLRAPGAPLAHGRALVPEADASCGDLVLAVSWKATRVAAVVRGVGFGVRLVAGDIDAGEPRFAPLEPAGVRVLGATLARTADGLVALWTVRRNGSAALRYRLFSDEGEARSLAGDLGELLAAEDDARSSRMAATATGPRELAAALATTHGPRLFQVRCGAAP
jgi:hypothetical protein